MSKNTSGYSSSQNSAIYINKKGINELFEAMMTALMIHKPDDHISFIRKCLDKVEFNPNHISWDHFIAKPSLKPLPPIAHSKPLIFILSSSGSLTLCSRLLDHFHVNYLSINYIANIDEDEPIGKRLGLKQYEHRYKSVRDAIEQRRAYGDGFLISGELDEQKFLHQWQRKLGRIDLIFILSFDLHKIIRDQNFHIVQIDLNKDFDDILTTTIHYLDEFFPQDTSISQRSSMASLETTNHFNLPIIFCIDNRHRSIKNNRLSIDNEFEMAHEEEEEHNNSFIYSLCQRLSEEFSFKHIHYEALWNFDGLKDEINESMNTCSGYIIDHFPSSFYDLKRFQSEIGSCSVLIYIGEHQTARKTDEINGIIEKFKQTKNVIYVDSRMEVDEIYDDLKSAILQHL